MGKFFEGILDWSEVWAPLIPLLVLALTPKHRVSSKPILFYLWIALALNVFGDIIAFFKVTYHFPSWLQSNNPIYNIHSIVRFACFSYFFMNLHPPFFMTFKKVLAGAWLIFIVIDFYFFEHFFYPKNLSGNLLSVEAYLLLIYCMLYYLSKLKTDDNIIARGSEFWIVTGLSIYVVTNFFVFLFYVPMITQNPALANRMWNVHNIAYIIFYLFISKAFYATVRH
jgi:hypothetical protein